MSTKLYIKHMVGLRCEMIVKNELHKLGLNYAIVKMGVAEVFPEITPKQRNQLRENLLKSGLELLK